MFECLNMPKETVGPAASVKDVPRVTTRILFAGTPAAVAGSTTVYIPPLSDNRYDLH